jgi:hypothetical protein
LLQLLTTILHRKQTTPNDAATHTFFQLLLLLSNSRKTPQDGRNKKEVPPPSANTTKTRPLHRLLLFLLSNREKHLKMDATRRRLHDLQRRRPNTTSPKPEVPAQRFKPGPAAAAAMTNHVPGSFFFSFSFFLCCRHSFENCQQ